MSACDPEPLCMCGCGGPRAELELVRLFLKFGSYNSSTLYSDDDDSHIPSWTRPPHHPRDSPVRGPYKQSDLPPCYSSTSSWRSVWRTHTHTHTHGSQIKYNFIGHVHIFCTENAYIPISNSAVIPDNTHKSPKIKRQKLRNIRTSNVRVRNLSIYLCIVTLPLPKCTNDLHFLK